MSNSPLTQIRDDKSARSPIPKAMIHKRILSVAERDPNATVGELSRSVSGARPDLVERVLEEYGDPGDRGTETERGGVAVDAAGETDGIETLDSPVVDAERSGSRTDAERADPEADAAATTATAEVEDEQERELSAEQYEILAAIREHPNATQRDLADLVGVSCATINRRVNSIEGFEWDERAAFATSALDGEKRRRSDGTQDGAGSPLPGAGDQSEAGSVERQERDGFQTAGTGEIGESLFGDVELTHKVVHACMASDRITEAEEMKILRAVLECR
jgi:hypothetical protein